MSMKPGSYAIIDRWQLSRVVNSISPQEDVEQKRLNEVCIENDAMKWNKQFNYKDESTMQIKDAIALRFLDVTKYWIFVRRRLHEQSKERASKWGNTIEGQRLNKERLRQEKLDKEEAERLELDRKEDELRKEERRKAIERANKLIFESDDRVKNFNKQVLLAEVVEERKRQIELKKQLEKFEKEEEEEYYNNQVKNLKLAERRKRRDIKRAHQRGQVYKQMQVQQLDLVREKKKKEKEEQEEESKQVRREAEEEIVRQLKAEEARKQKQRDLALSYKKANEEQQQIRLEQKQRELEEEKRIEQFATLKQEQLDERKRREQERFQKKLEQRQKLIDQQVEALSKMRDDRKARFEKELQEQESLYQAREQEKQNRKAALKAAIDRSRSIGMELEAKAKREEKERERIAREHFKKQMEELAIEDALEKQRARDKNHNFMQYQQLQHQAKLLREKEEQEAEKRQGYLMNKAMEQHEAHYKQYVSETKKRLEEEGLDTRSLNRVWI